MTAPASGINGIHHLTAISCDAQRTVNFYTRSLGLRLIKQTVNFDNPDSPHLYFGVGDGKPGTIVTYFAYPHGTMRPVNMGTGMTHHFALSVPDEDALAGWCDYLNAGGIPTTDIKDRAYFRTIYLHDPDGHIVEIASETPGFRTDETIADLGRSLQLPPWLESRRREIERNLTPMTVPDPIGR